MYHSGGSLWRWGRAVRVWGQRVYGNSLYLSAQFCYDTKIDLKKKRTLKTSNLQIQWELSCKKDWGHVPRAGLEAHRGNILGEQGRAPPTSHSVCVQREGEGTRTHSGEDTQEDNMRAYFLGDGQWERGRGWVRALLSISLDCFNCWTIGLCIENKENIENLVMLGAQT